MGRSGKNSLPEILKRLDAAQLKFVAVRMHVQTDREAAEAVGIAPQTVYNWSNKEEVNEAVRLAQLDTVEVGREQLRRLISKAIDVLEDKLDAGHLSAVVQVLDRTGLEAKSGLDITSKGEKLSDSGNEHRAAILGALGRIATAAETEKVAEELAE